jgi:hypothetical protein
MVEKASGRRTEMHPLERFDDVGKRERVVRLTAKLLFVNLGIAVVAVLGALVEPIIGAVVATTAIYATARIVLDEVYAVARLTYDAVEADGDA